MYRKLEKLLQQIPRIASEVNTQKKELLAKILRRNLELAGLWQGTGG